jgi:hypothetical protein
MKGVDERNIDEDLNCARKTYGSEATETENNVAFIYADWIPLASSTKVDTPTLTRFPSVDDFLPRTLNVNAPSDSVFESSTCVVDSESGKPRGPSANEMAVSRFDAQE